MAKKTLQDVTTHDVNVSHAGGRGAGESLAHTPEWYKVFGDKCPVCGQPARFA